MDFEEFVTRATGHAPYGYQAELALYGPPDVLEVPTGAGKTLAAVLPWLWRRRFHSELAVREATPRRLVVALPMRVLVEQTYGAVSGWVSELGLEGQVDVHRVMGGEGRLTGGWRDGCHRDAVLIGTIDMLLSRALNRGYGDSRWMWPIDFGLLNSDTHWVFDEIQLMGPALPTSRQLAAFRSRLGTAGVASSMWMSATVDPTTLATVDNPDVGAVRSISDADRSGHLAVRLGAQKMVRHQPTDPKRHAVEVAQLAADTHRPGTLTLVIANTVARAVEMYDKLSKVKGEATPDLVLVHSRFRPADRAAVVDRMLSTVPPEGRIVVSTQVIEAGVDISAATMITELAPWPSIVQRAGRCNRAGEIADAQLIWVHPPKVPPYEQVDLDRAASALEGLEGERVTPDSLAEAQVHADPVVHPVLRTRDLLDLFDTTPDLAGNDVDVARFIREANDTDAYVAWWPLDDSPPSPERGLPSRDERCPVPVAELRDWLRSRRRAGSLSAWRYDHIDAHWQRCGEEGVVSGAIIVLDVNAGGYGAATGWAPKSTAAVPPVVVEDADRPIDDDTATGADPISFTGSWLSLVQHLDDTESAIDEIIGQLGGAVGDLDSGLLDAARVAGRLHDIGKAHPVFQTTLERAVDGDLDVAEAAGRPWAKSPRSGGRHERPHFRHEFASALALLDAGSATLDGVAEPDLVRYLVAAHHGRVRIGARALPGEANSLSDGVGVMLGVVDGDVLPAVQLPEGTVPESVLRLGVMSLGNSHGLGPSWTSRALALRDRPDIGVFRLGFLEALVRMGDWRASAEAARREVGR